jgi:putative hydrolase of the HAD superfamily
LARPHHIRCNRAKSDVQVAGRTETVTVAAVIFDWGGTLTPWHDIEPMAQFLAVTDDPDAAQRLCDASDVVWARSRDEHRSATLAEVFQLAGVAHTDEAVAAFHRWWEPHTFTDPDATPLLIALRERGIKVGVLSNTIWSRADHERIFDRDGLSHLLDGAVYTSEIAWTKPHREAFQAALDALGRPDPRATVFVGDRLFDDVHGAAELGMRTVYIPHSTIPADQHGHTNGTPDAVVQRLGEVLDVVDAWR